MSPKLSILLATYDAGKAENQPYLELCLQSLNEQTFRDFELILVSSGKYNPNIENYNGVICHEHSDQRLHFPEAITKAYELSNNKSEYILFLNDDTILNKHCLEAMLRTMEIGAFMLNPRSNCDDNGRFYLTFKGPEKLQYRIEDLNPSFVKRVIHEVKPMDPMIIFQDRVHLYCTMMRRSDYEKIGRIDPKYKTGFDDHDLSYRGKQHRLIPAIAMHAYCLHASGVTADIALSQADREFNEKYFREKWQLPS